MKTKPKITFEAVVYSWDFGVSFLIATIFYITVPHPIPMDIVLMLFQTGMTVLSIVFSIFFAALAIIISAPVDDFISFMDKENEYSELITFFKWTLSSLFLGLLFSILGYFTFFCLKSLYPEIFLAVDPAFPTFFILFFFYGIISAFINAIDSIRFASYRADFLLQVRNEKEKKNNRQG